MPLTDVLLKGLLFFRAALKYLGCTDLSSLSAEELRTRAYVLSVAALLGKDVYNFGELLAHPGLKKHFLSFPPHLEFHFLR